MCVRVGIKWLEISEGFSVMGMVVFTRCFERLVEESSEETSLRGIKLEVQDAGSLIIPGLEYFSKLLLESLLMCW